MLKRIFAILSFLAILAGGSYLVLFHNVNLGIQPGNKIDEYQNVKIFYNGGLYQQAGKHVAVDGYVFGIKFQSGEFVRRYYYERFQHKMHEDVLKAKDFFNAGVDDGKFSEKFGLRQYHNGSTQAPEVDDVIVFSEALWNPAGHVAIISKVGRESIEIVQQNPGPFIHSREHFKLRQERGRWYVDNDRVLGWLRLPAEKKW